MKKVVLFLVAAFMLGCGNPGGGTGNGPITGAKLPGKFSATVLSDTIGSKARGVSLGTYTVANSKSIYFLLRNVGDFPITDIALTPGKLNKDGGTFVPITDNGITASPGTIGVLETSGKANIETVIEVDINHGDIVGLISQQYIQKADFAGTTLRITGKTTNEEGKALDISLDADIETLIKVASFEVYYSVDGGSTFVKAAYGLNALQTYLGYLIPSAGKNHIKVLNTGNVPLRYKVWKNGDSPQTWENFNDWVSLNPGAYSSPLATGVDYAWFLIDTVGVAFDNNGIDDQIFRSGTSVVISGFTSSASTLTCQIGD